MDNLLKGTGENVIFYVFPKKFQYGTGKEEGADVLFFTFRQIFYERGHGLYLFIIQGIN